jgi:uncharacterized membrane-anchored protein
VGNIHAFLTLSLAMKFAAACLLTLGFSFTAHAQEEDEVKKFLDGLKYKNSDVVLANAAATIHGNNRYYVLEAKDAQSVLEDLWGNPPDDSVLGMIVPSDRTLADEQAWAVVLTYENDGYVSDDDAATINYNDLLAEMQEGTKAANEERVQAGYAPIQLVGWAEQPSYDAASHKLYWAKNLKFGDEANNVLNYDVRVLGRHGVLSMNAVADLSALPAVKAAMPEVIRMAEFNSGARYADFNESTDKVAEYGIAALVAGGIAAKSGLLSKLLALLIAGKKFVVMGLIGIGVLVARMLGKKKQAG